MAKDPAFLFYTGDFITGTMWMTNEELGIYVRLLCSQHQHGGIIDKKTFNEATGDNSKIRSKFIETDKGFINERLMNEMEARQKKSTNLSLNAKEMWKQRKSNAIVKQKQYKSNAIASDLHMPIEDEDENKDINIIKYAENFKKQLLADQYALESSVMNNGLSPIDIAPAVEMFFSTKIATGEAAEWKTYKEAKRNFIYWLKFYKDLKPKQNGKENSIGRITESDAQKFLTEIERRDQRGDFNRNQI